MDETGADVSVVFVPPAVHQGRRASRPSTPASPLLVVITEGVPVHDTAEVFAYAQAKGTTRMIGPNCPGIISPGRVATPASSPPTSPARARSAWCRSPAR